VRRWTFALHLTSTWWLTPFCIGLGAAGNNSSMRVLLCKRLSVQCFRSAPLGEESRPHPYLRAELRIPHSLVELSHAQFCLSSHNLGVEIGRHQGVFWFAHGCKRCAALGMHDLPVDGEAIYSFHALLPLWLGGSVNLYNCHLRPCRISCAVVMFTRLHYLCISA
jgi:hypothetical protein